MYLVIRDATGRAAEGVAVVVGRDRMRVALRGCSDTVELRRSDDQWLNDSGDAVEFDVLLPGTAAAEFYAQLSPMASTARN
jgi:hypothetical protein